LKCYRFIVIQVQRFMPAALAQILRKAPLTDDKIAFAWRSAVGPAIARGTTIKCVDGVLRVAAREKAWLQEIERSDALIRARLDALLGRGVVRAITIEPCTTR
jgi:predicted nucleic acid-binding Zn ribbon protein